MNKGGSETEPERWDDTLFSDVSAGQAPESVYIIGHHRMFCFPRFICRFLRARDNAALFHIH